MQVGFAGRIRNFYCPDCADDLPECAECGQHFEDYEGKELNGEVYCGWCRDSVEEEEEWDEDEADEVEEADAERQQVIAA